MENLVHFGTLHPDGSVTDTREIRQGDMMNCPHFIIDPEHYDESGRCKCNDAAERARLIRYYGYEKRDFSDIPLREDLR